jgi:hypothetical protein
VNPASLGDLPAVLEWAERRAPGARVAGCAVRPLAGGAVARRVDQVTLHLTGHHEPLELVCKQAPAHEIAGLRTAQAVRQESTAIPELVAWGSDWLITPLAPGSPLAWGDAVPANLVTADSADVACYARTWQQLTGQPPPAAAIELGYRWAALQIPVQYLPWTTAHRPTREVEAALDRIERALGQLSA